MGKAMDHILVGIAMVIITVIAILSLILRDMVKALEDPFFDP